MPHVEESESFQVIPDETQYDYTAAPHWILLHPNLNSTAMRIYLIMRAHVNTKRRRNGDTTVWPSLDALAEMIGMSQGRKVVRYIKELEEASLIRAERTKTGMKSRNTYVIRMTPPPGFDGLLSTSDFYGNSAVDNSREKSETPAQTVVPKQALRSAQTGTIVVPKRAPELNELKLNELPPPTSSANAPVDNPAEPRSEEEDFPSDLKNFVFNLDYHGQTPERAEYIRVAKALRPLWGQVNPTDLKRRLQKNANINAQSLVAVYVKRLSTFEVKDFNTKSAPTGRANSSGRPPWCDQPGVCDPNSRHTIDAEGYVTKFPCPNCSGVLQAA